MVTANMNMTQGELHRASVQASAKGISDRLSKAELMDVIEIAENRPHAGMEKRVLLRYAEQVGAKNYGVNSTKQRLIGCH